MFRSPYGQTYTQRRVTTLAPDFLVYINGDETIEMCPECGRRAYFNDHITDVNVQLTLESGGSSASFTLATPRHGDVSYVKDGTPIISPMNEVEIFMKGRFLTDAEPRYYQVFWGLVTTFTEDYSDGVHSVSIECRDILRWWELMVINVQPSGIATDYFPKQQMGVGKNGRYWGQNPYSIIYNLAQTIGTLQHPASMGIGHDVPRKRQEDPIIMRAGAKSLSAKHADMMKYWRERFNQIGKALRIFGLDGVMLRKGDIDQRSLAVDKDRIAQGTQPFATERVAINDFVSEITPFPFIGKAGPVESVYQSKLDIAREVASFINYEFYMDATGEIIFKPPFYNLDVRPNQILSINDQDIISWSFSEDETSVFTRCDVYGSMIPVSQTGKNFTPLGWAIDQKLARQYGIRQKEIQLGWLRDARACHLYAIGWLDRQNARRFTGTLAMPGRPELRLGYPIYIESRDAFYYVETINHSFNVGGTFTTTLGLRGVRRPFTPPHFSYTGPSTATPAAWTKLQAKATSTLSGKEGKPNIVLVNDTRKLYPPPIIYKLDPLTGQAEPALDTKPTAGQSAAAENEFDISSFGTTHGVYTYDTKPGVYQIQVVQNQVSVPAAAGKSASIPGPRLNFKKRLVPTLNREFKTTIPVTDESGYDLIGMFPYGRNLKINAKGQLTFKTLSGFSALSAITSSVDQAMQAMSMGIQSATASIFGNTADTVKNMSGEQDPSSKCELNPWIHRERLGINQIAGKSKAVLTKAMSLPQVASVAKCSCSTKITSSTAVIPPVK